MPNNDNITNIFQFGPGFMYGQLERPAREAKEDNWYDGNFNSLLPVPTIDNGYALFDSKDLIKVNPFRAISNFHEHSALAEPPTITSEDEATQQWINENWNEKYYRAFKRSINWWSRKDRAVLISFRDGTLDAINPSEYFRVGRDDDPDAEVGHIIARPFRNPTREVLNNPNLNGIPDRIKVWRYEPQEGINSVSTYYYDGGTVGEIVAYDGDAGITGICVLGENRSWYSQVASVVAAYLIKLTNLGTELNHYDNALTLVPDELFNDGNDVDSDGNPISLSNKWKNYRNAVRPAAPVPTDGTTSIHYEVKDPAFEQGQELLGIYDYHILLGAGSSPESIGWQLGKNESGQAREKAQDNSAAKIRELWRQTSLCLPKLLQALGAPTDNITVSWPGSPFENRAAAAQEIRLDAQLGIISLEEARVLRHYGEPTNEQRQRMVDRENARNQRTQDAGSVGANGQPTNMNQGEE